MIGPPCPKCGSDYIFPAPEVKTAGWWECGRCRKVWCMTWVDISVNPQYL